MFGHAVQFWDPTKFLQHMVSFTFGYWVSGFLVLGYQVSELLIECNAFVLGYKVAKGYK